MFRRFILFGLLVTAALCALSAPAFAKTYSTIYMAPGDEFTIRATESGGFGSDEGWRSENPAVVKVLDSSAIRGHIQAVAQGETRVVHKYYIKKTETKRLISGHMVERQVEELVNDYYPVNVTSSGKKESSAPDGISQASLVEPTSAPAVRPSAGGDYAYKIFVTKEATKQMKKYKTLKKGDSGSSVKKLKERLEELGYLYDAKSAPKRFDQATQDALLYFQISNNLTGSDGVAYPYTQYKLFDEFAIPEWGRSYETLTRGDDGWHVKNLQKRLIDTGYLSDGGADGSYGPATEKAVSLFQRENGLNEDGIAHDWLQDMLFSSNMNSHGVK